MTEQTPILSVQGLCAGYRGHTVLRDISFALAPGEILCVAGESGCGKSTLLRALMGADDAVEVTAGTVILAGREPMALPRRQRQRYRCRHMGMIFQNPGASFDPVRPYGAQFRDTLKSHGRYDARRFAADAEEALGRLGLTDPCRLLACRPYELSGGMNQRMAMALSLLLGQRVLLADEPTAALDVTTQAQIVRQMMELRDDYGTSIIVVTHNLGIAAYMSDYIVVMKDGKMEDQGTREYILHETQNAYTRSLLGAVPSVGGERYV